MELTTRQIEALKQVFHGADIYDYATARLLRDIQTTRPELIHITPVMMPVSINDKRPYFGAVLTKAGKQYIRSLMAKA